MRALIMSEENRTLYPLSGAQTLTWYQLQYSPNKRLMQIPIYVTVNRELDIELLKKAIEIEHERNDCLRERFVMQDDKCMQYFIPETKASILETVDFTGKTKKAQDRYFEDDVNKVQDFMNGDVCHFMVFKTYDGGTGIYMMASHMIMDASAVVITVKDIFEVYLALEEGRELPKPLAAFEDCLKKDLKYSENEEAQKKDTEFFQKYYTDFGEPIYAGVAGIKKLKKQRKMFRNKNMRAILPTYALSKKMSSESMVLSNEKLNKITAMCEERRLDFSSLLQLAIRSYASKVNDYEKDVTYIWICNNRATLADKRSGGCRMLSQTVCTRITEDMTAAEAVNSLAESNMAIMRHINFSGLKAIFMMRSLFKTVDNGNYSAYWYTYLPVKFDLPEGWEIDYKWYNPGHALPLYIFITPDIKGNGLRFNYEYRPVHIKKRSILALHKSVEKILDAVVENPDITIGEILHNVI